MEHYPSKDKELLLNGFKEGFSLHYAGDRSALESSNLISVKQNPQVAVKLVEKEVELGRMAGPFVDKPFSNLRVSPIGLVPKKDGAYRLIHHLSFPQGSSINDFIHPDLCKVKYASFDDAIDLVSRLGQGAQLGKMDIKSAFRLLPISPNDFELLGVKVDGKYYFDKCLPMGCSISCSLFEKFSTFLEWVVKQRCNSEDLLHYLDDFFFGSEKDSNHCLELMQVFEQLCGELGVPIASEKTVWPTPIIIFLGLVINTVNMTVSIPAEKLFELRQLLECCLGKKKVTLKFLQSLVGSLNFCSRAIPASRAFCRRFYDAMSGVTRPTHFIRVTKALKEDIKMWLLFLDCFNGSHYFPERLWVSNSSIQLFTDAAGNADLGCAAYFHPLWIFYPWPQNWNGHSILRETTLLELIPIVLAFQTWGPLLRGKKLVLHVDNLALVAILNKNSSKSSHVMQCLRPLVLQGMLMNIQFKAIHVPGKNNEVADALSRKQWVRFQQLAPSAKQLPDEVPASFHLLISSLKLEDC